MYKSQQIDQGEGSQEIKPQRSKKLLQYNRTIIHLKNCIHDGYFSQSMKREGPGITVLDSGCVFLGNFKNDQYTGVCLIFISLDTYFIGQFNKGALDGQFVIRSPKATMYSAFVNNKIQGELLIIDYQNWVTQLWAVQSSGEGQIIKQMSLGEILNSYMSYQQIRRIQNGGSSRLDKTKHISQQHTIIKSMAPYIQKIPNISQLIKQIKSGSNQFQGMGPQIFSHKIYQKNQMITLGSNNKNTAEFLGIVLNKRQQLIAYGQFKEYQFEKIDPKQKASSYDFSYQLSGIGVKVQQIQPENKKIKNNFGTTIIYSGQFVNHELTGEGTKQIVGQRVIYGKFFDSNIRNADISKTSQQKGQEIKRMELKRFKSIHIHSLKFLNNYSNQRPIFILKNLFELMKPKSSTNQ